MKSLLLGLIFFSLTSFGDTGWIFKGPYTTGTNNPTQTPTAGATGSVYFNTGTTPSTAFMKMDEYPTTNWQPITSIRSFYETCTITSAAAATPVSCLPSVSVAAGQAVYLTHWSAKVNGATSWTVLDTCSLKDTNASPVTLWTIAVTALSGNAFIANTTTNVTLGSAYSLGTGTTKGAGLNLACDLNGGAGSNLVVVLSGFIF